MTEFVPRLSTHISSHANAQQITNAAKPNPRKFRTGKRGQPELRELFLRPLTVVFENILVGAGRFERPTPCAQGSLRHS